MNKLTPLRIKYSYFVYNLYNSVTVDMTSLEPIGKTYHISYFS